MGRRAKDSLFEGDSAISSLGNSSVGMQRWKEKVEGERRRTISNTRPSRGSSGRRSHSDSYCKYFQVLYIIAVGALFLSVLQGQSLKDILNQYAIRANGVIGGRVPLRPQADSQPISTFAILKDFEMFRATALAAEEKPELPPKSYAFMEHNLVSIKAMAYNNERRQLSKITPLFWHIPKAGGTTVHQFAASCLRLSVASNIGIMFGHANETTLQLIDTPSNLTYVNIDVTTGQGIERARKMGFVGSGSADIVISPLLNPVVERLFSPKHQAAVFTVMRHPVERSISMFYYLQDAYWEPTYRPEFKNWTLLDYARRSDMDSDWMVRFLVDKPGNPQQVPLTRQDLERAKIIVRDKIWVGFVDNMEQSIEKFGRIVGWSELAQFKHCVSSLGRGGANQNRHEKVNEESEAWREIQAVHSFDMELYNFAKEFWDI